MQLRLSLMLTRSFLMLLCGLFFLSGCATTMSSNAHDPFESYNRAMFSFNETIDDAVLQPVATVYEKVVPQPLRQAVSNIFSNVEDVYIGANNLLQGKFEASLSDGMRVLVNSIFGFGGILDIASEMRLEKHDEDFGQTLGHWGVGEGPYIVLPFFGSRTARDVAALPVDLLGEDVRYISHIPTRYSAAALQVIDMRARLLGLEKTVDEGTLDKYAYVRDFYLQQRRYKIMDGNVKLQYEDFD